MQELLQEFQEAGLLTAWPPRLRARFEAQHELDQGLSPHNSLLRLVAGCIGSGADSMQVLSYPVRVSLRAPGFTFRLGWLGHLETILRIQDLKSGWQLWFEALVRLLKSGCSGLEFTTSEGRVRLDPDLNLWPEEGSSATTCLELLWSHHRPAGILDGLAGRFSQSPVPIEVDGLSLVRRQHLGRCALSVLRQGHPGRHLPVEGRGELHMEAPSEGYSAWLGLGGDWSFGPSHAIVTWIFCGLTFEQALPGFEDLDMKLLVWLEQGEVSPQLDRLEVPPALLGVVRQDIESGLVYLEENLQTLVREPAELSIEAWNLICSRIAERRYAGQVQAALDLCRRTLTLGPRSLSLQMRTHLLESGAALTNLLAQPDEAQAFLEEALALRMREGLDESGALDDLGVVSLEAGKVERAAHYLGQAEAVRRERDQDEYRERLVPTLLAQAELALLQGQYAQAERAAKRAIARAVEGQGETARAATQALLSLAQVYSFQDRAEEAQRLLAEADSNLGDGDPLRVQVRLLLAGCAYLDRRLEAATTWTDRAREVLPAGLGPDHPEGCATTLLRALILDARGESAGALHLARGVLKIREQSLGAEHPSLLGLRLVLSRLWLRSERPERALAEADLTQRLLLRTPDHPLRARAHDQRARVKLALEDLEGAERDARQALALFERLRESPESHPPYRDSLITLAYRWWARGDRPDCRSPLVLPARRLGTEHEDVASALAHLARVLRERGAPEEAARLTGQALAIRQCQAGATLVRGLKGLLRLSPEAMAVRLSLRAPGRQVAWLRLDTAHGRVATNARNVEAGEQQLLALVEGEQSLLTVDSALLRRPLDGDPVGLILYAADPGSSQVSAIPYVATVGFKEGPPLRIPVRV